MTPKEATARVIESPPEVEPVNGNYLKVEAAPVPARHEKLAWLWLLWEHRRFLGRVVIWGLAVSTIVAFIIPKRYESTTRLMPPDSQSASGMAMMAALFGKGTPGSSIGLSSMAGDMLGLKSSGALFADILSGRTVQDRLIDRFDLRGVYWDRYWEDARKDLARHTDIVEDRKSGVITITVKDRDPRRAAQMAQAYVEELDRLVAKVSTSSARRERIFIEQRLQTVKQDLDNSSRKFSEYASKNTTVDMGAQAKATVEAAAILEGQLIAAQSELDGLEQVYTKNNVRVRSLQARVDELRTQLHRIGGETYDKPGNSAPEANFVPDKISGQEFPSIRQLPLLGVRWADLYREAKIQETVYELLTQQYEIAKIQEAKEIPTVKVLDAPFVPEKSFPPKSLIVILGTLFAFAMAGARQIGSAYWQALDQDPRKEFIEVVVDEQRAWMAKRYKAVNSFWHSRRRPKHAISEAPHISQEPESE